MQQRPGYLYPNLRPTHKLERVSYPQIFGYHGTEDANVPLGQAQQTIEILNSLYISAKLSIFTSGHVPSEEMDKEFLNHLSSVILQLSQSQ